MFPIVFINCDLFPFVCAILSGIKLFETRNKNTLKKLVGRRILLAETRKGKKPLVKCFATIDYMIRIDNPEQFEKYRKSGCIEKGSCFDFIPGKAKYLYHLTDIVPVPEFIPPEGIRHGRTWMELNATIDDIMNGRVNDYQQWIADYYHCSDIWGQKQTQEEMKIQLTETLNFKNPGDYSPDPSLYKQCARYWNELCERFPG